MPATASALSLTLLFLPLVATLAAAAQDETPAITDHAMVVSVHHEATDAGITILKQGGNAVDAAVATGFALAVVHPVAGNLGGGGFMLVPLAKPHEGKRDLCIDYREEAPAAASPDMYLDAEHHVIPNASTLGYKSIGVPGSVAGLAYAEKTYGKLGLKAVIAPAIKLAEDGFALSEEEAQELHSRGLGLFADSKRIFQRDGKYYAVDEVFKQPELARTLKRIAADPDDF